MRVDRVIDGDFTGSPLRQMWSNTPLNELDLTKSEKGGPSYRHLPKNFPLLSCSEVGLSVFVFAFDFFFNLVAVFARFGLISRHLSIAARLSRWKS